MDMANLKRELAELRAEIIKWNDAIVELLDARVELSQKVGAFQMAVRLESDRLRAATNGLWARDVATADF